MADLKDRMQAALGDRYRIERELGHGGMAVVFLAEDTKHGRPVALKVLRPELAQALGGERFLREIRISAQLRHPNILTLIDSGEAAGFLYYIMPFVAGESLRSRLDRERQLPLDDALRITAEVADALSYAHSLGIVHRDIKPENILDAGAHAVVADFGIARAVSEARGEKLTESGLAIGTPAYMSPEQATGAEAVDTRSDLYSLACVLYEMLAGHPPHTGTTAQAVLARKLVDPIPALRVVRDSIPAGVESTIMRALARVPADRFATVAQFRTALESGRSSTTTARRRVSRPLLAVVAALVLLAVSYALFARGGGSPAQAVHASFTQLTSAPGVEWFPTLSPDGKWLAYAGEASGNRDIYLQSVPGQTAINLTPDSPADDDQPVFSPDGEHIAFRSERDGGGLFVMGRTGDGPKRVTRRGFHPTWSPDGTAIAFADDKTELNPQNVNGSSALWSVQVATGALRQIFAGDAVTPSWSPHGYRIAYTQRSSEAMSRGVWSVPAAGGAPVAITHNVAREWGPVWSPDGAYIYFASDRGGSMNLWRVPIDERSGKTRGDPEPVTTPAGSVAHITIAADGRHVAYASALITSNLQRLALDPVTGTVQGEPSWVTTGSRRWSSPDPSPDGRWLTFYSLVQPEGDVYVVRSDGTELRQVTTGDSVLDRVPRWSPDGQWIAFFSNRSGLQNLWKIRPDGSDLQRMTEQPMGQATWSPDGKLVAGAPMLGYGDDVYVFDPSRPWGAQTPTLPQPDSSARPFDVNSWSPDGRWLAGGVGQRDSGIVVYAVADQTYRRLTDYGQWPVWLADSRHILFVSGGKAFYVVDRATKAVRRVYQAGRDVIGPPRLTRDGIAFYSRRVTEADIWMATLQ